MATAVVPAAEVDGDEAENHDEHVVPALQQEDQVLYDLAGRRMSLDVDVVVRSLSKRFVVLIGHGPATQMQLRLASSLTCPHLVR